MYIYGRNPVKEAYRAGKTIDKLFMQKVNLTLCFLPFISSQKKRARL